MDMQIIGISGVLKGIGEGLKKNHTILGIHLIGNKGKVDSKGIFEVF